jgi:pilus assembly protein Flp/PilA
MFELFKDILIDDSGATAVEYGLIASIISISMIVSLHAIGVSLGSFYGLVSGNLGGAETDMARSIAPRFKY